MSAAYVGVPTQAQTVVASAPGRVNLLGEHTDYNDGYVLPTVIPQRTTVRLRGNAGECFALQSRTLASNAVFTLAEPPAAQFARYVYGCVRVLAERGTQVPGFDLQIDSEVPIGVGLSSSAALEVATLRALRQWLSLDLDELQLALLAQRAEVQYAGVHCGVMDQVAVSCGLVDRMLFLDTRTLALRQVVMPPGAELLVIDSGTRRALAGSGYNTRRAECEEAARLLGVRALRDVIEASRVGRLPAPLRQRARHVVSENQRVLRAARGVDARTFGALMNESHASLRDDFEVSTAQLDRLVALLQAQPAVFGARLTGAGFGGACVALCRAGTAHLVGLEVLARYRAVADADAEAARVLVPTAH